MHPSPRAPHRSLARTGPETPSEPVSDSFELPLDHSFFSDAVALNPVEEDALVVLPARLTLEEFNRRLWFRRMVVRLMAALATFTVVALLLRITQSG